MDRQQIKFPDLNRLFRSRSVLLIGASDRFGSIRRIALENISQHSSFDGPLYLVNPSRDTVPDLTCPGPSPKCRRVESTWRFS